MAQVPQLVGGRAGDLLVAVEQHDNAARLGPAGDDRVPPGSTRTMSKRGAAGAAGVGVASGGSAAVWVSGSPS